MIGKRVLKVVSGVAAVLSSSFIIGATGASAQYHDCEIDGSPGFSECGETSQQTSIISNSLGGVAAAWTNQQLNFGNFSSFVGPTAKLRHTEHDGLKDKADGSSTGSFEIDEASAFANASYDLPGTYFGGKVRVAGLVGWTGMQVDSSAKTFTSDIDSVIYGGSYLWSQGNFYSMSLIIGISGEVDGQNFGGISYDYGVSGYFTNSVYGYTFDMANGVKFDVRGNLSSFDIQGDSFNVAGVGDIKGSAEGWAAGITGTVFTVVEWNGSVARPFLSLQYRNVFDEDIKVGGDADVRFEQDTNFGKAEAGYDYVSGPWTYGAAVYTEFSGDESTVGGRVGASLKLQ
jgi:hypothetical protein